MGVSDSDELAENWDPVLGRNVAKTTGLRVPLSAHLKLMPVEPDAPAEVWEWDHFHIVVEPELTYPGCDDFDYSCWSTAQIHCWTDDKLKMFLYAATQVRAACIGPDPVLPCWRSVFIKHIWEGFQQRAASGDRAISCLICAVFLLFLSLCFSM